MKSYQITWNLDDVEVAHLSGSNYVRSATSRAAKRILETYLRNNLPHLERLEIGSALQRTPSSDGQYIDEHSRF